MKATTETTTEIKPIEGLKDIDDRLTELITIEAEVKAIEAKQAVEIAKIFEQDSKRAAELSERHLRITNELTSFAKDNRENATFFPNDSKSITVQAGTITIHAGQPAIALLKGFSEEVVIKRAYELNLAPAILRTPDPELDKEAVMRLYNDGTITPAQLLNLGLEKKQEASYLVKTVSLDKLQKAHEKAKKNASKSKSKA